MYLAALLTLAALVWWLSERFWPVTLFLFGPRWVLALPLALLLPAGAIADRRLAAALAVAAALLAEPLFGWSVPWGRVLDRTGSDASVRVVTWNVGGGVAPGALDLMMALEAPDVVVVQESSPEAIEAPPGWHRHVEGGMALLSRFPVLDVAARDPKDMWQLAGSGVVVRYGLDTLGRLDLTSVHLETPREGLESILRFGPGAASELVAKNEQREIEARVARRWVDESPSPCASSPATSTRPSRATSSETTGTGSATATPPPAGASASPSGPAGSAPASITCWPDPARVRVGARRGRAAGTTRR